MHARTHMIRHQIKVKVYDLTLICDLGQDIAELFLVVVMETSPLKSALDGVLCCGLGGV